MTKHLRFGMIEALDNGICEHPQDVMEKLGITYQHATPETISDSWIFWNCENIPNSLPTYLEIINCNPLKAIGYGLDEKTAKKILSYKELKK